jgi:hypothetical protein
VLLRDANSARGGGGGGGAAAAAPLASRLHRSPIRFPLHLHGIHWKLPTFGPWLTGSYMYRPRCYSHLALVGGAWSAEAPVRRRLRIAFDSPPFLAIAPSFSVPFFVKTQRAGSARI